MPTPPAARFRPTSATALLAPAFLSAVLLAAAWAVLYATAPGIGLSPDSIAYVENARAWTEQLTPGISQGAAAISGGYGPLYPAVLSAASAALQLDPQRAARWVHVALFPAALWLVAITARRMLPKSAQWWSLLATALYTTRPELLRVHTMAWSEPLFLCLLLCGFLALERSVRHPGPGSFSALCVVTALIVAARFAGTAFVATASLVWLFIPKWPRRDRLVAVALLCVVGLLPTIVWSRLHPGWTSLAFHPPAAGWYGGAIATMAGWVVPRQLRTPLPLAVGIGTAVAAFCTTLVVAERRTVRWSSVLTTSLPIFATLYVVVLVSNVFLRDLTMDADERILAPLWVSLMLIVVGAVGRLDVRQEPGLGPAFRRYGAAGLLLSLVIAGADARQWLVRAHREGQGYSSRAWQRDAVVAAIADTPTDATLITNGDDVVRTLTGRAARRLPVRRLSDSGTLSPQFDAEMGRLREQARTRPVFVVYFTNLAARAYLPTPDDLRPFLQLETVFTSSDGAIYRARPAP